MKTVTPDITIYRGGLKCRGIVAAIILMMTASVPATAKTLSNEIAIVKYCRDLATFTLPTLAPNVETPSEVELAAVQSVITKVEECMKLIERFNNLQAATEKEE